MTEPVIVDTGPLVALLHGNDQHHSVCSDVLKRLQSPLITTWLVITEAAWLLRKTPGGASELLRLIELDIVRCFNLDRAAAPQLQRLLVTYHDLQPQLADVSLVYVAELLDTTQIFTLDRRDFAVYRNSQGNAFQLLPEVL